MFTMRIMPKMSESPPAKRKRSAPYETPLKSWLIQKSNGQAPLASSLHTTRARVSTAGAPVTAGDCTIGALSVLRAPGGIRETAERALRLFANHRSEEHTSELQSLRHLVCRLLLEKKKKTEHQSQNLR